MSDRTLEGTVTGQEGAYTVIACPEAPEHLRVHYLLPWHAEGAKVGDRVRLAYQVSPSFGAWVVVSILR